MNEQEGFKKWLESQKFVHDVKQARSVWDAALEWAKSQQKPSAWVSKDGFSRSPVAADSWRESGLEVIDFYLHPHAHPAVTEIVAALEDIRDWLCSQQKSQSKGGYHAFDQLMLTTHRDIAEKALAKWENR